ncbi:uncharacterized protein DNG_00482 [Cephalotrichum gorgonifer]|uniref:DUF3605 domain-containing protein n=1 Tax=Cephalotrichum gorgonifer TaxID=2041049 RepID=A0AAE8SRA0_9PEZI|nr:uncharacterized protein DNG_00482 [Cephalotrichum gorgonifer]
MKGEVKLPYWQVNVPPEERTDECPEHLLNLPPRDVEILSMRDADFSPMTWEQVLTEVGANRIDSLQRTPSDLLRYIAFNAKARKQYGSVTNFLLAERLGWTLPLVPKGAPFEHPEDMNTLYNDWPYGIDKRIVHLCVWTKFPFEEDPETGDLTDATRAAIDNYVAKVFRSRIPAEKVLWFRNWSSIKSVRGVEHFHVMLFDPDRSFVHEVTSGVALPASLMDSASETAKASRVPNEDSVMVCPVLS